MTRGGETLFASDFADGTKGWRLHGGDWKAQDGALRQNTRTENIRALTGNKNWSDYTYSLKARKLSGAEGFLIIFRAQNDNEKSWWNLGGWGNQRHALEMGGVIGDEVPGQIETGRWYDIRVELKGNSIKCYLDGKLVHEATAPMVKSLYASATRAQSSGEVILKVVNASTDAQTTDVQLNGASVVAGPAKIIVLASENPTDENTIDNPTKVVPVTKTIDVSGPSLHHTFPGNSVTVMRLKVK